jgi:mono/diheme cytochrome c family protein
MKKPQSVYFLQNKSFSALALAALVSLSACGVGDLDAESQRNLAIAQGQTPLPGATPSPSPGVSGAPTPTPAPVPAASPSASPSASPAPSASPTPTPTANTANGKQLYDSVRGNTISCSSCHSNIAGKTVGPSMDPTYGKLHRAANNSAVISQAIRDDKGGMGQYANLFSASELADIAAYIGDPK